MSTEEKKSIILVVEDERPISQALKIKLESEGFGVRVAMDGVEAMEALLSDTFDCILLDLILPRKDGFAVMEEMKEKNIKTPIIIISNLGQESDIERCKAFGVVQYFIKAEISITDVVAVVKKVVEAS